MRNLLWLWCLLIFTFSLARAQDFEGFETGNFAMQSWAFGGYADWELSASEAHEGFYSARSGTIADDQFSSISLSLYVIQDSPISFWWLSSSETFSDITTFYVDGDAVTSVSGLTDWAEVVVDISTGYHSFVWTYEKNSNGMAFDDAVYLDDIVLPATTYMETNMMLVTMSGTTVSYQDDSVMFNVLVRNIGSLPVDEYTVQIYKEDGEIVAELPVDHILCSGQTRAHRLSWIIPLNQPAGSVNLYSEVIVTGEMSPDDNVWGPRTVTVLSEGIVAAQAGYGDDTTQWFPLNVHFPCSVSETIYFPSELVYQGDIIAIGYHNFFSTTVPPIPIKIFMGSTSQSNLSNNWIPSSQLTEVFNDTYGFPSGSNHVIIPITPFAYNGGNLVIMANRVMNSNTYSLNERFFYSDSSPYYDRSRSVNSNSNISTTNPPDGYVFGWNPNTTFYFQLDDLTHIEGTITNALSGEAVSEILAQISQLNKITATNIDGLYHFGNIQPGEVTIEFSHVNYESVTQTITVGNGPVVLDIAMNPKPMIALTAEVSGSIEPGVGLEGAYATLSGTNQYSGTTDANGMLSIPDVIGNEPYDITISLAGYQQYQATINTGIGNYDLGSVLLAETAVPPVAVFATQDSVGNISTIVWEPPPYLTRGFESYGVYRFLSTQATNPDLWDQIAIIPDDTLFVDTGWNFLAPELYQYAVTCIHSNAVESSGMLSNTLQKYDVQPVEEEVMTNPPHLQGNQPNPFNPSTTIYLTLGDLMDVSSCQVVIYNVRGQLIKTYDVQTNGSNQYLNVQWDGRNRFNRAVPSGIYLYQLRINGVTYDSRKMDLMK